MNAKREEVFEPPLEAQRVAALIGTRAADRAAWQVLRRARRQAWIVLHDREDTAARDFVNAINVAASQAARAERLRHCRVAALARAIRCNNRAARIMELAHYKHLKRLAMPHKEVRP